MKTIILALAVAMLTACSSTGPKKVVLDSSGKKPDWVEGSKIVWADGDSVYFKSKYTVKENERINGCFDLAKLDSKEALVSEIQNDIKGTIDQAQMSISNDAELVLGKSRSSEFAGRVQGFRFPEQYSERYQIGDLQEQSCYVLGQISKADYNKTKNFIIHKIQEVDPAIKAQITQKHVDFFRKPASSEQQ